MYGKESIIMRLDNAYRGISKIYTAEILSLIAAVLVIAGLIVAIGGSAAVLASANITDLTNAENVAASLETAEVNTGALVTAGAGTIVLMIGGVIEIIAFILNIVGISAASKDERIFHSAMIWVVAGIVSAVVQGIFSNNQVVKDILNTVNTVCEVLTTYYVICGVISLANRVGRSDVAAAGAKVIRLTVIIYAISAVFSVVSLIIGLVTSGSTAYNVISAGAGVTAIVAAVLSIISYIVYLGMLSKAKKMLQ